MDWPRHIELDLATCCDVLKEQALFASENRALDMDTVVFSQIAMFCTGLSLSGLWWRTRMVKGATVVSSCLNELVGDRRKSLS